MTTDEFQQIWQSYDKKLQKSMDLNLRLLEDMKHRKIRSSMRGLIIFKSFSIVYSILWNVFCVWLIRRFWSEPAFVTAAIISIAFTCVATVFYVWQLCLIYLIQYNKSVVETQEQLATLETSIIQIIRILLLQLPIFSFVFIPKSMLLTMVWWQWAIYGGAFVLLLCLSIWLYRNIRVKNLDKKWMQRMLKNEGGQAIARARQFIREIEEYKKEM